MDDFAGVFDYVEYDVMVVTGTTLASSTLWAIKQV